MDNEWNVPVCTEQSRSDQSPCYPYLMAGTGYKDLWDKAFHLTCTVEPLTIIAL